MQDLWKGALMDGFSIEECRANLAAAVRKERRAQDLSQMKLAELADVCERTVIKIETGKYKSLTLTTIQAVTKALGITVRMSLKGGK